MVAHAYNPSSQEVKGDHECEFSLSYIASPCFKIIKEERLEIPKEARQKQVLILVFYALK